MIAQEIFDFDSGNFYQIQLKPSASNDDVISPRMIDSDTQVSSSERIYPALSSETYITHCNKIIDKEKGSGKYSCVYLSVPVNFKYKLLDKRVKEVEDLPTDNDDFGRNEYDDTEKYLCGIMPVVMADIFSCSAARKDYAGKFGVIYLNTDNYFYQHGSTVGNYDRYGKYSLLSVKHTKSDTNYNYVISGNVLSTESPFSEATDNYVVNGVCYYTNTYNISQYDRVVIIDTINISADSTTSTRQVEISGQQVKTFTVSNLNNISKNINYAYYGERPLKLSEITTTTMTSPFLVMNPELILIIANDVIRQALLSGNCDNMGSVIKHENVSYNYEKINEEFDILKSITHDNIEPAVFTEVEKFEILYFLSKGVGPQNSLMQIISPLKKQTFEDKCGALSLISNCDGFCLRYGSELVKIEDFLNIYSGGNASAYKTSLSLEVKNVVRRKIDRRMFPCGRNASVVTNTIVEKSELSEVSNTSSTTGGGLSLQTYTMPVHQEIIELNIPHSVGTKHINLNTVFSGLTDLYTVAYNYHYMNTRITTSTAVYEGILTPDYIKDKLSKKSVLKKIVFDYIRQTTTLTYVTAL